MASSSSSGLTFKLHPLVILNISDHYTRVKSQSQPPQNGAESTASPLPRVLVASSAFRGDGRSRSSTASSSSTTPPPTPSTVPSSRKNRNSVNKKVFPNYYILGWYSTGSEAEESDMQIHKALMDINESPVYVLLNPSINHTQKDLPATIYESVANTFCSCGLINATLELHVIDGIPQLIFVRSSYTIETVEAERISVDHVAHLKPSDGGSAATQLAAHLTGIHSAIKMLNSRIRVLHHYLLAMQKGDIPCENSLLRQVSSLLRRLPAIESEKFQDDFLMEYNDTLLITYLAMLTNCSRTVAGLVKSKAKTG
ncbi:hypothetical protein C3L33_11467, partial [Rhododendron williamsianum]